jgi:hypothetical protein
LKVKEYKWSTSTDLNSVPDSLKNEDAVILTYQRMIKNEIVDPYLEFFSQPDWFTIVSNC